MREYKRSGSREDLLRPKEDLGYLSGSRTDLRHKNSSDEYIGVKKLSNGFMHREDSGFVRESKEDLRDQRFLAHPLEDNPAIQRDDSAYVSSSTYFRTVTPPPPPPMPINDNIV